MENNKWIDDIMKSFDGLQPAEANPFLYQKIRYKMQNSNEPAIPRQWSWRLVAAMAVIVILNVFTIRYLLSSEQQPNAEAKTIANEYAITLPDTY